ncbi:TetR/AcrR family transcriptional regulator [Gordonia sp. NPDC058843]|uniref:TetR/AcrR family transcriptional regulator n=1 Tax=Gordonia sp. NPDC058843 TaxID=3346648 RepID=UPI00368CF493
MDEDSHKVWRGQTLHDRSLKRREQLLDVGEELLGSAGVGAVTMRAVVREAQLSPRYFYETFSGREDFLVAVYDRVENRLLERVSGVEMGDDFRTSIHAVCVVCGDFFEEDPRRARILLREPLSDDILRDHSARRAQMFVETMLRLLGAESAMSPRPERIPALATGLSGALVALYLGFADGRLDIDREQLAETAVDIVYALADAARPRDGLPE